MRWAFWSRSGRTPGPHPRKEPRFDGPLTLESLGRVFEGCVDYMSGRYTSMGTGSAR